MWMWESKIEFLPGDQQQIYTDRRVARAEFIADAPVCVSSVPLTAKRMKSKRKSAAKSDRSAGDKRVGNKKTRELPVSPNLNMRQTKLDFGSNKSESVNFHDAQPENAVGPVDLTRRSEPQSATDLESGETRLLLSDSLHCISVNLISDGIRQVCADDCSSTDIILGTIESLGCTPKHSTPIHNDAIEVQDSTVYSDCVMMDNSLDSIENEVEAEDTYAKSVKRKAKTKIGSASKKMKVSLQFLNSGFFKAKSREGT